MVWLYGLVLAQGHLLHQPQLLLRVQLRQVLRQLLAQLQARPQPPAQLQARPLRPQQRHLRAMLTVEWIAMEIL